MVALLLGLLACGADKEPAGDDTSTPGGDTAGDDTGGDADVRPYVVAVRTAECATNGDGVDIWNIQADVADPQDDVARVGSTLTVLQGGEELATFSLACTPDSCLGSWRSTDEGAIDCSYDGDAIFRIVVVDELGHASEPFDHPA